jgi:16S rRNA (uracil1498-N3)-methyltransferase
LEIDKGGFTDKEIMVFIGPEGGWTDEEVAMFHKYNVPLYSLGKQVLRAETASLIALYKVIS